MKIGIHKDTFVNNHDADIAVKNLAAGLAERGHEVALFNKTEYRCELGAQARAYCREHYSREKILDQWEVLFMRLSSG